MKDLLSLSSTDAYISVSNTFSQTESDLIVDESRHSFDLQHIGLVGSELMDKTVRSSIVPADRKYSYRVSETVSVPPATLKMKCWGKQPLF